MNEIFRRLAHRASVAAGSPWAFLLAMLAVVVWAPTGRLFGYSDSWQLVINTGTTVITFRMVFLIQNTQNREARVTQLKLDELLRAMKSARNSCVAMEDMSDHELERLEHEFHELHQRAGAVRKERRERRS